MEGAAGLEVEVVKGGRPVEPCVGGSYNGTFQSWCIWNREIKKAQP